MAATGARLGTGYIAIKPDFSGFQEKVGAKLSAALAPAGEKAGKNLGKDMARGIDRGGFRQAFAPLLRRFDKFGDDAGEAIAAKVGKGAKRAEGDMFGLADAVREVERRSKATGSAAKSLSGDMFGIAKAAKRSGNDLLTAKERMKRVSQGLRDYHARANSAENVSKKLGNGIRDLGGDLFTVVRGLKIGRGDFSGFNGAMSRINRTFSFFGNILRTLKLPAFAAAIGLAAQALSALAAGAVATVSALGPLAGLLVALPAGALAAAQAFGVLKLATSGVGDAVKAAFALQAKGGQQAVNTMRQQEDAAEQVADAERSLADTQRQAQTAQISLNEARKEARRELQDLKLAAEEAHDAEQMGNLGLVQARKELAKTLKDPTASGLDIRFAEEAVDSARNSLESTRLEAKRARQDNDVAQKKGVEGSKGVVAAKESLADANRGVAAAQRDLTKAIRDQSDAMKEQGSAADALQEKLAALPPSARKFAKFLIGLKPKLDDLRETAASGLLPGAEKGIKGALKNLGVFKGLVSQTSKVLGKLAAKAGKKLGSDAWGRDLGKIGATNTRVIERMGDAGLNLSDAFRNVLVSAEPFIDWLSKGVVHFSEWIKSESQAGRESGGLAHFFDETRKTMERVWPILKGVGGAFLNIGKAAKPLGDEILESLGKSAEGWREWTESTQGKGDLRKYFEEVKPTIWAVGRLVRDLSKEFLELGRQKGASNLLESVRKFLPTIREVVGALTGFASDFLGQIGELREEGLSGFEAFIVALTEHAGEAGVKMAQALVKGFLNAGVLGKLAIGAFIIPKLLRARGALVNAGYSLGGSVGGGIASGTGDAVERVGPSLKSRFARFGKTLGFTLGAIGIAGGLEAAMSDSRTNGVGDALHNFSVGFFRQFGVDLGETTAEEFSSGFKAKLGILAQAGSLGVQSIITPGIEDRATQIAESRVDKKFPGRGGSDLQDAPGFDEEFNRALGDLMRNVQARRASAKELFSEFWEDMGPDEKQFARQLRAALVQGDRLVQRTGVTVPKLKLETDPQAAAKAVKGILGNFTFLRKGIGNNLADITKVSKRTGDLIRSTFGEGTKEARTLTARNMRLTAQAIADQMVRSGDVTKKGLDRIKSLFRSADLISPSRKQAEGFGREWSKGMDHTKEVTGKGIAAMIAEAKKMPAPMRKIALETWLDQAKAAQRSGDLTTEAFRKMRSKVFAEFGQIQASGKTFNKEFAKGFVDMVNNSGGAMGVMMENVSNLLGTLGGKGKLNWKILNAKLSKDPNGASLGRQKGGPVPKGFALGGLAAKVPGTSTGDRHVLALGGRPVAKVESGEGIFVGNRKMMGAVSAANAAVPRFQTGGLIRGGLAEPKLEGNDGGMKRLGRAAIHKVFEGAKGYLDKHKAPMGGVGAVDLSGISGSVAAQAAQIVKRAHSPYRATLALFESLWAESSMGSASPGNVLQALEPYTQIRPAAQEIAGFLTGTPTWTGVAAIPTARENPGLPANAIAQLVQKSGVGEGNEGRANYLQAKGLALGTMKQFGLQEGGLLGFASGGLLQRAAGGALDLGGEKKAPGAKEGNPWNAKAMHGGPAAGPRQLLSKTGFLPKTIGRIKSKAASIASAFTGYVWGGGHGEGTNVTANGLDCSGAIAKLMQESGWKDFAVAVSTDYASRFHPGEGDLFTIWSNPEHTFADIEGQQWGTNSSTGLGYHTHTHAGFTPSHPELAPESESPPSTAGGTGEVKKPAEEVPPTYAGANAAKGMNFGPIPKDLTKVNDEIRKWERELPVYGKAKRKATKAGKPDTAAAIGKNLSAIQSRLAGLRNARAGLRFKEAQKHLKGRLSKALGRLGLYDLNVAEDHRSYETAAQFAEQVVGLEPQSPELPVQAKGESDKAYEAKTEGIEKAWAASYKDHIEGKERPAYATVLERVASLRNTILGAEVFGLRGEPSVAAMQTSWEKQTRGVDHGIDHIRDFAKKVIDRKDDWVQKYEKDHKGKHPKRSEYPEGLKNQLKERHELLTEKLPVLTMKDTQLREAIGQARESFYPGGDNRLDPNKDGVPARALPGSGSLEDSLVEVQGVHPFPEQHEKLDAGSLAPPNQAGRFGGLIWDLRETIEGLGLKVSSAIRGTERGESGSETPDNSEREALLEGLLKEANQRTLVSDTLRNTIGQFNASYPFAGIFHSGGVVPGPAGAERLILAQAGETVIPQNVDMTALSGSGSSASGVSIGDVKIYHHGDGTATVDIGGQKFKRRVEEISRGASRHGRVAVS